MRIMVNGLRLNVERAGTGPPILLLHGFTGSAGTWKALASAMRSKYGILAVDLIGHGSSDAPDGAERYTMQRCIDDLVALLLRLGAYDVAVLGYSMGGRVALHLALDGRVRLSALILESTSPGIDDPELRRLRRKQDHRLARSIEDDGVAEFVARWEALPLFSTQRRLTPAVAAAQRAIRLGNSRVGLANSLRGMGAGAQPAVTDRLGDITMPTLLIAGADDEKYSSFARSMRAAIPGSEATIVENAGHAVHVEQPGLYEAHVLDFLKRNQGLERTANRVC